MKPRIAAVVTEYWPRSHADSIVSKLMRGYEVMYTPICPRVEVVSLYTESVPDNDISRSMASEYGATIYPSVRDSLTEGSNSLSVDGLVLIGHLGGPRAGGEYEFDERGMPLDHKRRLFEEVAAVFRQSGRVAPVFHDMYLAPTWSDAKWIYDTAQQMRIPLMAGSSIPFTFRCPPIEVQLQAPVEEVVLVSNAPKDPGQYHAFEFVQSLVERRRGFETGVTSVQYVSGAAFWEAWTSGARWSTDLQEAALSVLAHPSESVAEFYALRSVPAPSREAGTPFQHEWGARFPQLPGQFAPGPDGRKRLPPPDGEEEAIIVEYQDGLRVSVLGLAGYVSQRGVALWIGGRSEPLATANVPHPRDRPMIWNFDHLAFMVDEFLSTDRPAAPVERTLLANGIVDAALRSRYRDGERIDTPHLKFSYAPVRA